MFEQIKRLLAPPVFSGDEEKTSLASLLNVILITIFLVAIFVIGSLSLAQSLPPTIRNIGLIMAAMTLVIQVIMRQGYVRPAAVLLAAIIFVGGTVILYINGSVRDPFKPALLVSIIIAGLFVGDLTGYVFAGLSIAAVVILFQMEQAGMLPTEYEIGLRPGQWINFVGIAVVTAVLLQLTNRNRRRSLEQLRASNEALRETSQRLGERTSDLELAAEIGRSLSQVRELDKLLQSAVNLIQDRFSLYHTQIYLVDPERYSLVLRVGTGDVGTILVQRGHALPIAPGSINGAAAAERRTIIVADTTTSPQFRPNALLPETRSEMAVPLLAGNLVLGVLNLQSSERGALSQAAMPTFETVANQLAVAIESANLFAQAEAARQEVETYARRVTRGSWDDYLNGIDRPEKMGFTYDQQGLHALHEPVPTLHADVNAMQVPVKLANEPIGLIQVATGDDRFWTEEEISLATAVANQVAQQVENLRLLGEAEQYRREAEQVVRRLSREAWREYATDHEEVAQGFAYDQEEVIPLAAADSDTETAIAKPLHVQNQVFGELSVSGTEADEATTELVQSVATQLSSHLESLRLSEQTEKALAESQRRSRELAVINDIARIVGTQLEVRPLLETILDQLRRVLQLDGFMVSEYDSARNTSTILMSFDKQVGMEFDLPPSPVEPHHFTYRVVRSRQPQLILATPAEVAEQRRNPPPNLIGEEHTVMASLIFAPMRRGEEVVGVLSVQSTRLNAYSKSDLNLVGSVANYLATALQNAQLFQTIQRQGEKERLINQVSQKIQNTLTMEDALKTAVFELGQALQARHTQVEILPGAAPAPVADNNGHHQHSEE